MRHPDDKHYCPLYEREVFWGDCYEVQEVREDNMDMELLVEPIDLDIAEKKCDHECRWCYVREWE